MKKMWIWIVLVAFVLIIGGYFLLKNNTSKYEKDNWGNVSFIVEISNFVFSPTTLTIKVGETITWTNKDSTKHTVTSDSGNELNSGLLNNGQSYSHTFNTAGTYDYHCTPHPYMKAKIIVE